MASMRDIKRRKSSIQSTQQITKAMKLVSTVKLQRTKQRAEQSKTYFESMYKTVTSMLSKTGSLNHPYLKAGDSPKKAIIVITSNRGLAGGYNSNVIKLVTKGEFEKDDVVLYTIGKKGYDTFKRMGYNIVWDNAEMIEEPKYDEAMQLCKEILSGFSNGEFGEIYLAYTAFKNTISHEPKLIKLLPYEADENEQVAENVEDDTILMNFEPKDEEALNLIIPKYVTSLIFGGMVEAAASENGARMQAMDSATSNAEEMISSLSLMYNRARQGSITQELTEIVAGANAIS